MEEVALPGFQLEDGEPRLVARVYVDTDLPHLDRPLDYVVPKSWEDIDLAGYIVQVPLSGSKRMGWVLSCERVSAPSPAIRELIDVVSTCAVVAPQTFSLARYVADRYLSTVSAVLSLAVPPRRASVEKEKHVSFDEEIKKQSEVSAWKPYPYGRNFIEHVEQGDHPRCVWTSIPGRSTQEIAELASATLRSKRSTLIITPTQRAARRLSCELEDLLSVPIALYTAEQSAVERYRIYRQCVQGSHRIVVGTRSAAWLPLKDLGLIIIWGDGDDHLREIRNPRTDALDIAVARAHLEHVALAVGSFSRSVKAQYLVARKWAISLNPEREVLRESTGRFFVSDDLDDERQGRAAHALLPPDAYACIRRGLTEGPVLILAPNAGYIPVVGCERCGAPARCEVCSGPLTLSRDQSIVCAWCSRATHNWRCMKCQGTALRWWRIGSERIGEEVGRSFAQVPLLITQGIDEQRPTINSSPRIVVATAGAQPDTESGYAALIIPSAAALASRPELWAPEEALRRWLTTAALVRPQGQIWVSAGLDQPLAQALIRWSPEDYIQRILDERYVLRFPPTASIVAIDGPEDQLNTFCKELPAELIGIVDAPHSDKRTVNQGSRRALIRCNTEDYPQLARVLRERLGVRSARKLYPLRLTLNPPELF